MNSARAIVIGLLGGLLTAFVITVFAAGIWWAMTLTESMDQVASAASWFVGAFIYGGALLAGIFTAWRDSDHPLRSAAIAGLAIGLAQAALTPYLGASWQLVLMFVFSYSLIPVVCAVAGAAAYRWLRARKTAPA
jgi:hypothetical protein